MKITKCDRCGKIFDGTNNTTFSKDGKSILLPIEMRFSQDTCNGPFISMIEPTSIDICDDCQISLRSWLEEFKNGGETMDA